MPTPTQTTPEKMQGSHRLRLLERRLAPITPMAPSRPSPSRHPTEKQNTTSASTPILSTSNIHDPTITSSPVHQSSINNLSNTPAVSDKPESVQSFASDESASRTALKPHNQQHPPTQQQQPPAMPSPQGGVRKPRRKNANGGATKNQPKVTGSKKSKNTPPTKRRLGRLDEFFKPLQSSRNQKRPASPSLGRLDTSSDSRPGATTITASTVNSGTVTGGTVPGVKVKGNVTSNNSNSTAETTNADSYKFLRGMIDTLRKENDALRDAADELRTENEDLHAQVDLELPQLRELVAEREEEVKRHVAQIGEAHKVVEQLKESLREALVAGELCRRKVAEQIAHANGERLGKVVISRGGVQNPFLESWQDGREWRKVQDELGDVRLEKVEVDRKVRLQVKRRRRRKNEDVTQGSLKEANSTRKENEGEGDETESRTRDELEDEHDDADMDSGEKDSPDSIGIGSKDHGTEPPSAEVDDEEELLLVRVQTLKWRETTLNERLKQMERERDCLIRELRRQNDERASIFGDCPTLHSRYVLLNLLGRGGFSEVFRAVDLEDGRIVACKIHQLASNWSEDKKHNFIKHAMREYNIHKELKHPRVVQMLNIFEIDDNSFGTVLQFCDGNDLDAYLRTRKMLPEREARNIIAQVFNGLHYLAEPSRRIIHYDLKPANILLSKGEVLITDFGLSKIMAEGQTTRDGMELTSQGAGTMWYLPPECFEAASEARINSKVDVWSAGVILFQMLYGRKPFGHDQTQEKIFREKTVQREELLFPDTPIVSDLAKEFIKVCLTRSATKRPDVRQILAHPFLKRIAI